MSLIELLIMLVLSVAHVATVSTPVDPTYICVDDGTPEWDCIPSI